MPALLALVAAAASPASMLSVYKSKRFCFEPFTCIKTRTIPVPVPTAGQVLIKVAGSSVNPCDVDYAEIGVGCSGGGGTLGMDVAGTIVAVGENVTRLKVGDEVWADGGALPGVTGGMAGYAVTNEAQTGLKPRSINATEAATIPLAGLTAIECLLQAGQTTPWSTPNLTAVITSGSGGTGFLAVQIAKRALGAARLITAASGADHMALVQAWGADVVVDYKVQEIFSSLPDESVDIVFDNYGAKGSADKAMRVLRPGGTYLLLPGGGGGSLTPNPKPGVHQVNFGYTDASRHEPLDMLRQYFDAGHVVPYVQAIYPLTDAASAYEASKSGTVVGKVAVVAAAG